MPPEKPKKSAIIGIGTDITDIRRVELTLQKRATQFEKRVLSTAEKKQADTLAGDKRASYIAKRFAAKEAAAKALGCGIGAKAKLTEISTLNNEHGAPVLHFSGTALKTLKALCKSKTPYLHISLSDDYPYALAFVVIEAR